MNAWSRQNRWTSTPHLNQEVKVIARVNAAETGKVMMMVHVVSIKSGAK
jgi:hypothetical protein